MCHFCANGGEVTLKYSYDKLRPSQGLLVFGRSCYVMDITDKLPKDIPLVKKKAKKDTPLTEWLLGTVPEHRSGTWIRQLHWMWDVLKGNNPAALTSAPAPAERKPYPTQSVTLAPLKDNTGKAEPMQFQKNGAARLDEILNSNSRAFLAAGLLALGVFCLLLLLFRILITYDQIY